MQKIPFENLPSTDYPVNASNLNLMQNNMENTFKSTKTSSDSDGYNCNYLNQQLDNLKIVKKWGLWPTNNNKIIVTDIDISKTRNGGGTLLAIVSGHSSSGDNTFSRIYMIRIGYNGSHITPVLIAESKGTSASGNTITFGVNNNGYLTLTQTWAAGYIKLAILEF